MASTDDLSTETVSFNSIPVETKDGLNKFFPAEKLPSRFDRGETSSSPSYTDKKVDVRVK